MPYPWGHGEALTSGDLNAAIGYAAGTSSAAAAATSATNAANSASAASTSASAASSSQTAAAASATTAQNAAAAFPGRNQVINGHMDIWQRGTPYTASTGNYTADCWRTYFDGTGATTTVSQGAVTAQAILDAGITSYLSYAVSPAGSGATGRSLKQAIENVRTVSGQTVTVSFWAWVASGTATVGVQTSQYFGTGGSPSATVTQSLQNVSLTTTPTKFSLTFTLPSIVGKTLGTNGDSFLELGYQIPLNTALTFNLTGVQLEVGSVATPFERSPRQVALALCQRYYQVGLLYGQANFPTTSTGYAIGSNLPVPMRVTPTAAVISNSNTNLSGMSISSLSNSMVQVAASVVAGGSQCTFSVNYALSAEL